MPFSLFNWSSYFGIIVGLHAAVRNNPETRGTLYLVLPQWYISPNYSTVLTTRILTLRPLNTEHFCHKSLSCCPIIATPTCLPNLTPPPPLNTTNLFFISIILSFHECYINGIIKYLLGNFWDWLFPTQLILRRFIQVVVSVYQWLVPFYCWEALHGVDVPQLVYSLLERHLVCSKFLAIRRKSCCKCSCYCFFSVCK